MRVFLLALALVFLVAPAGAQSQYADGEGLYVSFDEFRLAWQSDMPMGGGISGEVGRRLGNGVDVGLVGSYQVYGLNSASRSSRWEAGVSAGLTREAPLGTVARVRGVATYGAVQRTSSLRTSDALTFATGDLSATLARTLPVVGSVRLQPTVGVYGRVSQRLLTEVDGLSQPRPDAAFDMGLQLELPIRFRLFGAEAAIAPSLRLSGTEGWERSIERSAGTSLRLNF